MADMSKAEKLAAARKKLKEFQQRSKESPTLQETVKPIENIEPAPLITMYKNGVDAHEEIHELSLRSAVSDHSGNEQNTVQINFSSTNYNNNEVSPFQTTPGVEIAKYSETKSYFPQTLDTSDFLSPPPVKQDETDIASGISTSTPLFCQTSVSSVGNETETEDAPMTAEMVRSSSESLRQLAMQMNGLIGQEHDFTESPTILGTDHTFLGDIDKQELLSRNQQLTALLADKDKALASLHASLAELQANSNAKEAELQQAIKESEERWTVQTEALKQQLQLHTQTVGILVAEKTEAQAALSRTQLAVKAKAAEAEEAQGRLRASRQRLSELESEVTTGKNYQEQNIGELKRIKTEVDRLQEQLKLSCEQRDESRDEASQLHQRLQARSQEMAALQIELQERQSQLSIAQVRLQQLGGSAPGNSEIFQAESELQAEHERRIVLEKEVAELRSVAMEKEQSSQQYQQFIEQLNAQLTSVAAKLQEASRENNELNDRQESLIRHMSELESRLQRPPPTTSESPNAYQEELQKLKEEFSVLQEAKQCTDTILHTKEKEANDLKNDLSKAEERIHELESNRPDEKKLLAAMESDKVAAARATTQNTQLKQQMLEQQHVQAQLIDRLRHFEAQAQHSEALQRDLLQAQEQVKSLKLENSQLKSTPVHTKESKENSNEPQVHHTSLNNNPGNVSLSPEAEASLQVRFTDTMRKLAEMSDEKQRLEHLVLQLQGETETIGEYVTLYQQQRSLLKERAAEKDREMAKIATDREQMRQKLQQVNQLVSELVNKSLQQQSQSPGQGPVHEMEQMKPMNNEVATQITSLLSEICGSKTLADPVPSLEPHSREMLHPCETMLPCPLCSGRLEVV